MKNSWNALLPLLLVLPAYGQDPAPADQPAEAPAAETAPADSSAPADTGAVMNSISTDSQAAETPPAEAAPAETPPAQPEAQPEEVATIPVDAPAEPSSPVRLYGGLDWVRSTVSASTLSGIPANDYDSGMYRLRVGRRLFDNIGVEAHFGVKRASSDTVSANTDSYYGVYAVPSASLFDVVNLAFPVGYARTNVTSGKSKAHLNSVAYGLNLEFPLRTFTPDLPDLRFEAGWMIYYQKVNARVYGLNAGLRYDFDIAGGGGGSPFSGLSGMGDKIGGFFKSLWPFGKGDASPQ